MAILKLRIGCCKLAVKAKAESIELEIVSVR